MFEENKKATRQIKGLLVEEYKKQPGKILARR
jgi:hypothetical protein